MLREQNKLAIQAHKTLDICLTAVAFITAYFVKRHALPDSLRGLTIEPNYYIILLLIIIIWFLSFAGFNLYTSYRRRTFGTIFLNMVKAVSTGLLILTLVMYLFKLTDVSRIMLGIFYILNVSFLAASKWTVYWSLSRYRKKGFNFRRIIIIGTKESAKDVISTVIGRSGSGFKVIGCLGMEENETGIEVTKGVKVIGTLDNMKQILLKEVVDEIIFALPLYLINDLEKHLTTIEEIGVTARIMPEWQIRRLMYQPGISRSRFDDFLGIPTLELATTPEEGSELLIKISLDYLLAASLFVLCLPLFALIGLAIKIFSPGPLLFKQKRCGLNGREFLFYKFRTMVVDAEHMRTELEALNEVDGPVFKIKKDPRIIPFVGSLLRKSGLDELPQLVNVLKGEMSLVGPRPPIPAEVKKYDFWQRRRLSMKPGLTCLWQCKPNRNDVCFEDWMNLDLNYIDNWSLKLDFKILLKTTWVVLCGGGR